MDGKVVKYDSTRKRSADTELAKATRRFKDDTGYDEGDWGRADTKYAPGPTYDHELRPGSIVEDEEDEFLTKLNAKPDSGHTYQRKGHEPVRVQHAKNGMYYAWRGSDNVGTASLNHKGYFTSVHVEPKHRRTGVASALYNHVEKHAGLKLKPSERHTSDEAKKFWANRKKVQESIELQEMKGWMSPSGKPSTVSGHHAYEHHPDIWQDVDKEFRKKNPKAKRNLSHEEKWKSVGIAQRKGYTRFGREQKMNYSYVHYDKDAPGGKESALHALRHLKPRFGERIHVTTKPEATFGHEHTFDSPGRAAHHIRNDGENEMKESKITNLLFAVLQEARQFDESEIGKQWDEHNPGDVQAQLPITHCAICGETGHPASKHVGSEAGKKALNKAGISVKETEIKGNDRPEKCPDCGMMHAPSVPCPKKKLLDELGENFTLSKLGTNHPKGSFEYFHKPSKTKYTMTHAGVKDGRTYWKSANAVGSHGHRDDVRRLRPSMGEAEMAEGQKKYDRDADIRAIARERVGQVPGRKVIVSKKDKKPKHKADYFKEDEGEVK